MSDSQDSGFSNQDLDRLLVETLGKAGLGHLSEEELAGPRSSWAEHVVEHFSSCQLCKKRRQLAKQLLKLDGIDSESRSQARQNRQLKRIDAALDAELEPGRLTIRIDQKGRVRANPDGLEIVVEPLAQMATRQTPASTAPLQFKRQFGPYDVGLSLVRLRRPDSSCFDLIIHLAGTELHRPSAMLLKEGRERAIQPVPSGTTTFADLEPGEFTIVIEDHRVLVGCIHVDLIDEET